MDPVCPSCNKPLEDFRFHMVASPNADWLKGGYREYPRYSLHREHMRRGPYEWEYLCVPCFEALPCSPSREESQRAW